jgi:RNA polymerase sigma-70 factor (ECF subfamily)
VRTGANGQPAVATYAWGLDDADHMPFGISMITLADSRIVEIGTFHDVGLIPAFGLPARLPIAA